MFTGREWLADVQLYDYRNRLYNPDTGTFMQSDPLRLGGGDANLFRFCGGDPVNFSDPTGDIPVYNARGGWYTYWADPGWQQYITGQTYAGPSKECAAGAQFLSGAPDTRFWFEGASVTSATMYGSVIAAGWQNGGYPSMNRDDTTHFYGANAILNHTAIFLGLDADGNALVVDQWNNVPFGYNLIEWKDLWEWHEVYSHGTNGAEGSGRTSGGGRGAGGPVPNLPLGLTNLLNHFEEWSPSFARYYGMGILQFGAGWGTGSGLNPGSMGGASAAGVQGAILQTLLGTPGGGGLPGEGSHPVAFDLE